jgi:hypothetical protein
MNSALTAGEAPGLFGHFVSTLRTFCVAPSLQFRAPAVLSCGRMPSSARIFGRSRLLLPLLFFASLATPHTALAQSGVSETPLCTVLKDPLAYDHKYVKIRGTVRLGFEDFTLHSLDCETKPQIWLMFAGDVATPAVSTWNDTERTPGQNLVFAGNSFSLNKDDNFVKFFSLITARSDKNPVYRVTATLTGGFFAANAKLLSSGGSKLTSAYGHLNCCHLLLITSISDVESDPPAPRSLDGQVVSDSGAPVSGVSVVDETPTPQPQRRSATTGDDGHFQFPYAYQILQFRKDDLGPLTQLLGPAAESTLVVLHDSKLSDWVVSRCTEPQMRQKRIGSDLLIETPSGAKVRKEGRHGETYVITYAGDSSGLRITFDPKAGDSDTHADWLISVSIDERWIKDATGKVIGLDAQGLWADHNRWRYTAFRGVASAQYATNGPTATFYNEVISSACDTHSPPVAQPTAPAATPAAAPSKSPE